MQKVSYTKPILKSRIERSKNSQRFCAEIFTFHGSRV